MPTDAAAPPRAGDPGRLVIAVALAGAIAALYGRAIELDFAGDDFLFLDRARIASLGEIPDWFSLERNQAGMPDGRHAYRPLSTNVWFGAGLLGFGPDPRAFHLAALALAWVQALLAAKLLESLGCTRLLAAGLALASASSAIAAEAQLWLSVVQDQLASTAVLACVLRFRDSGIKARVTALGWLFVALLSKEIAVCTPFLLLALRTAHDTRRAGHAARDHSLRIATLAVLLYLGFRLGLIGLPDQGPYALGFAHLRTNLERHLYWSANAVFRRGDPHQLALASSAALLLPLIAGSRRRALLLSGLAWYAAALAPALLLRAHAYPFYLTLPSVGLAIAAAAVLETLRDRVPAQLRLPLGVALLALFAASSWQRFEERRTRLAQRSELTRSVIAQWRERFPTLPPGSRFVFELPPGLPPETLFIGDGAALRVHYADSSLRVYERLPDTSARPATPRAGELPFVRLTREGRLEVIDSTAPPLP
jgi:hypothetical protein